MATKKTAPKRSSGSRRPKDFISFILAAEKDKKLTQDFLLQKTAEELYTFFDTKGYTGIPKGDCEDILKAKNKWDQLTTEGHGKPPCNHGRDKGY
jgi:hypothetical protein